MNLKSFTWCTLGFGFSFVLAFPCLIIALWFSCTRAHNRACHPNVVLDESGLGEVAGDDVGHGADATSDQESRETDGRSLMTTDTSRLRQGITETDGLSLVSQTMNTL